MNTKVKMHPGPQVIIRLQLQLDTHRTTRPINVLRKRSCFLSSRHLQPHHPASFSPHASMQGGQGMVGPRLHRNMPKSYSKQSGSPTFVSRSTAFPLKVSRVGLDINLLYKTYAIEVGIVKVPEDSPANVNRARLGCAYSRDWLVATYVCVP
ncbi:hypothetical protein K402DRAFT_189978 [Aulographum hederae CBS 113979]|uniref:Uncharacterized protein n=1 Tax=Aulographum hederae CBS 113979 TaxID=1176131 RepID=A0A6G1GPW5_9PEZI|nr:hypothetical protein K402DRAFT_189978 [Aulographum hederae CBS 113979]